MFVCEKYSYPALPYPTLGVGITRGALSADMQHDPVDAPVVKADSTEPTFMQRESLQGNNTGS